MQIPLARIACLGLITVGCHHKTFDSCQTPIAEFCSSQGSCNWAAYESPSTLTCDEVSVDTMCGAYKAAIQRGVDTGETSYYDRVTGMLVAVVGYSANFGGSIACVAGPSDGFDQPNCPDSDFTSSCADAGAPTDDGGSD